MVASLPNGRRTGVARLVEALSRLAVRASGQGEPFEDFANAARAGSRDLSLASRLAQDLVDAPAADPGRCRQGAVSQPEMCCPAAHQGSAISSG